VFLHFKFQSHKFKLQVLEIVKCYVEPAVGNGWCEPLRDALRDNTPVPFRLLYLSRTYNVPTEFDSAEWVRLSGRKTFLRGFIDGVKRVQAQYQQKHCIALQMLLA
jgi:hypothetical protein